MSAPALFELPSSRSPRSKDSGNVLPTRKSAKQKLLLQHKEKEEKQRSEEKEIKNKKRKDTQASNSVDSHSNNNKEEPPRASKKIKVAGLENKPALQSSPTLARSTMSLGGLHSPPRSVVPFAISNRNSPDSGDNGKDGLVLQPENSCDDPMEADAGGGGCG